MPSALRRQVKNVVNNYSEAEKKVREATSNDPWGPPGSLMSDIADLTYNVAAFSEIMSMLWRRLGDRGRKWRHAHKALTLLDYLVKTGSERVALQCRENVLALRALGDFRYVDRDGRDQGAGVRDKARRLQELLKDAERLKVERAQALRTKERVARVAPPISSDDTVQFGRGSSQPNLSSINVEYVRPTGSPASYHGAASPCVCSELEQARPQTSGEEELQLQLALAMSREAAVQEQRMRQGDNLRLRMAWQEISRAPGEEQPALLKVMDTASESPADQMSEPWAAGTATPDPWPTNTSRPGLLIDPWAPCPAPTTPRQAADPWGPPAGSALTAQAAADHWTEEHVTGGARYAMPLWSSPSGSPDLTSIQVAVCGLHCTTGTSVRAAEPYLSPGFGAQNLESPVCTPGQPTSPSNPFLFSGVVPPLTSQANPFVFSPPQPAGLDQGSLNSVFSGTVLNSTPHAECHMEPLLLTSTPPHTSVPSVPPCGAAGFAPTGLMMPGMGTGNLMGTSASVTLTSPGAPPQTSTTNPFLS